MKYEDLDIRVAPIQGESYPVSAYSPAAGHGESSLRLPFEPQQIGSLLAGLGRRVRGSEEPKRDVGLDVEEPAVSAEQVGGQLFDALFSGGVLSVLDRSQGRTEATGAGLRIKIHLNPEDTSLAQLASLPWEFLYRRDTRKWLNLSKNTPIVRYLDVLQPQTPLEVQPPLRILVAMAQPAGYATLDLKQERDKIVASGPNWRGSTSSSWRRPPPGALNDRLTDKDYHVLHYMGHGSFDRKTGRGVLLMEGKGGQPRPIDGPTHPGFHRGRGCGR